MSTTIWSERWYASYRRMRRRRKRSGKNDGEGEKRLNWKASTP